MNRNEASDRSPLRILEQSIHGGLGKGNLGVVISRAGVGKSAFLIDIALDDLMRDRKVLHVSIGDSVDHVRKFYDETFLELVRLENLADIESMRMAIERKRHIHAYQEGSFRVGSLTDEARYLRDHAAFVMDTMIIDNFPFEQTAKKQLEGLKELASEFQAEVWLSALSHRDTEANTAGYPDPVSSFDHYLSVKLYLEPVADSVRLRLLKVHENDNPKDLAIDLDPRTLLLMDREGK